MAFPTAEVFQNYHTFCTNRAAYRARHGPDDPVVVPYEETVRNDYTGDDPARQTLARSLVASVWAINRARTEATDRLYRVARTYQAAVVPWLDTLATTVPITVRKDGWEAPVGPCDLTQVPSVACRWHLDVGTDRTWSVRSDVGEVLYAYHVLAWYPKYHGAWWCGGGGDNGDGGDGGDGDAPDPNVRYRIFRYLCRIVTCTARSTGTGKAWSM